MCAEMRPQLGVEDVAVKLDVLPRFAHLTCAEDGPVALVDGQCERHDNIDPSFLREFQFTQPHQLTVARHCEDGFLTEALFLRECL